MMETYSIILFDGECNLCDGSVTFIIDRDPNKKFKFASIQSAVGKELIKKCGGDPEHVTAMYLIEGYYPERVKGGQCYRASTAALRIAKELSGPWPLFYIFIIVPRFIRDAVYYAMSSARQTFFGTVNTCRVMTPELKERFLDPQSAS